MIICNFTLISKELKSLEFVNDIHKSDFYKSNHLTYNDEYLNLCVYCNREVSSKYKEFEKMASLIISQLPENCIFTFRKVYQLSDKQILKIYFNGKWIENDNLYFYK